MPELPEVETTKTALGVVLNAKLNQIIVRNKNLRWPVPSDINKVAKNQKLLTITRRGKYLLLALEKLHIFIHLGMSGSLTILSKQEPPLKHDHVDFVFSNNIIVRYNDPRRFGCVLYTKDNPYNHKLLSHLGPEPLNSEFNTEYLYNASRKYSTPIKTFIMDSKKVVGVGNIYANEALFFAKINPLAPAKSLSYEQCKALCAFIKKVLKAAIKQGGTTLRDHKYGEGKTGYFQQKLKVYGREDKPCYNCDTPLTLSRLGNRATVFCANCQELTC